MKTLNKEEFEKLIFLLEEAEYFMNMVPNKKRSNGYVKSFEDSYTLVSEIGKFLKTLR